MEKEGEIWHILVETWNEFTNKTSMGKLCVFLVFLKYILLKITKQKYQKLQTLIVN